MATSQYTLLDQADEDKLHATRLLTVEEKPFKRLTKRLLAPTSPIQSFYSRLPTPPADSEATSDDSPNDAAHQKALEDIKRFREDVILDFAAFESSIARIQFLRASNEKERQRYADEKVKIQNTAQAVRDHTSRLRVQLDEAQRTLAIRKTYDVLADQITSDRALKPRDEQHVNVEKLKNEIEDLERESREHSQAWVERREQFGRVVNEGMRLRRLVRDEKEPEPESRDEGQDMLDVGESRDPVSNMGTPRPDPGGLTPRPAEHDSGERTPAQTVQEGEMVDDNAEGRKEDVADAEMADDREVAAAVAVQKPADQMDTS